MMRRKKDAQTTTNCSNCGSRSKTATKSNQVETSRSAGKRSKSTSTRSKSSSTRSRSSK